MEDKVCLRCGHVWTPRVPDPLCCPACKRYDWDIIKDDNAEIERQAKDAAAEDMHYARKRGEV